MTTTRAFNIWIESAGERWAHARVRELAGKEAIGQLFSFDVEVVCDHDHELPERALPGEEVGLVFEIDGEEVCRVHGILGPIRDHLDAGGDHSTYRLRVVPRVFRLTQVETQEIFLDQSIPDILRTKLERHDFGADDYELRLHDTYPAREFVAQYQESDLAFLGRLAEHAGISYFFEHESGRDKLIFTDRPEGFRPAEGAEEVPFRPRGDKIDVFALEVTTDLAPTSYIVQDYNYRTPRLDLSASFDLASGTGGGIVEYGSHAKTPDESERLARIRAEERLCQQRVYEGKSARPAFHAGARTTLLDHPKLHRPEPLLFVAIEHEAHLPVFSEDKNPAFYASTFRAIPAAVQYRPARSTPRPRIAGVVTGVIQPGAEGETGGVARLDSEGRYLVQLHFDTTPPGAKKASHWMRMAQPFAGPGYGMHLPLRRGTEVVLAFTNGDPDRPVILGALYNAASPSPVVAANSTKHQIKTESGVLFELSSKS